MNLVRGLAVDTSIANTTQNYEHRDMDNTIPTVLVDRIGDVLDLGTELLSFLYTPSRKFVEVDITKPFIIEAICVCRCAYHSVEKSKT